MDAGRRRGGDRHLSIPIRRCDVEQRCERLRRPRSCSGGRQAGEDRCRRIRVVSRFVTYYRCCEPRVTNIKRAAAILDGLTIKPGATFSLNRALGERTRVRGFVPAPTISGGRLVNSVGGGISQLATTLYNAAFFAGLELVAHTPHSFYISRYPKGREATISWAVPS